MLPVIRTKSPIARAHLRSVHTAPPKPQKRLPAAYYRGGTSRAIIFKASDLPLQRDAWAPIFRGAIGSPDPYGRQLDGMGGGLSSLSKVCVVGPSTIGERADVDYTFAAIGVRDDDVDYSSNCGNMSAAIGPFAVDSGLVVPSAGATECAVMIHNTNTGKLIRAQFPVVVDGGEAAADGKFSIDGVAGTAAPVKLDFMDPGGAKTGQLLPTGNLSEVCDDGIMTCIDVGNPCVFVEAEHLLGTIPNSFTPDDMEQDSGLMKKLDAIRRAAGVKMGLADKPEHVPGSIPKIAMAWKPRSAVDPEAHLCVRALSVGQPHKAIPVTVALSLAAAARLPGTVVHKCLHNGQADGSSIDMSHPTGLLKVDAHYDAQGHLHSATVYRTARRLMQGVVFWK